MIEKTSEIKVRLRRKLQKLYSIWFTISRKLWGDGSSVRKQRSRWQHENKIFKLEKKTNPEMHEFRLPRAGRPGVSRLLSGGWDARAQSLTPARARVGRSIGAHWRGRRPPFATLSSRSRDSSETFPRRQLRATVGVSPCICRSAVHEGFLCSWKLRGGRNLQLSQLGEWIREESSALPALRGVWVWSEACCWQTVEVVSVDLSFRKEKYLQTRRRCLV